MLEEIGTSSNSRCDKKFYCGALVLGLAALFGFGTYLVYQGYLDNHSAEIRDLDEVIDYWNTVAYPKLANLEVTVADSSLALNQTSEPEWPAESGDLTEYTPLKFTGRGFLFEAQQLVTVPTNPEQYKQLGNLTLLVNTSHPLELRDVTVLKKEAVNLPKHLCEIRKVGCWSDHVCYYHFELVQICVLFDEDSLALVEDYRLGCETGSLETFKYLEWLDCSTEPSYSGEVDLTLRSVHDPYIHTLEEDLQAIAAPAFAYYFWGILLMVTSAFILVGPALFFCRQDKQQHRPLTRTVSDRT